MTAKTSGEQPDSVLIDHIVHGDTVSYEVLIRRYNALVYRIGRSCGFGHQDTDDLMQEAYVGSYFGLPGFEGRSSFKTWLCRIMYHACHQKRLRAEHRPPLSPGGFTETPQQMPATNNHTERAIASRELGHVIETALEKLPEIYASVFTLRELNGLSVAETAGILGISETNVKVRLNRAKGMLRREIRGIYTPEDIYEFNLIYCDRMVEQVMKQVRQGPASAPR